MDSVPEIPKTDAYRGSARRSLVLALFAVAVVGVTVILWFFHWRSSVFDGIRALEVQYRQAGYPISNHELDEWYEHVADEDNAAVIFEKLLEQVDKTGSEKVPSLDEFQQWSEGVLTSAKLDDHALCEKTRLYVERIQKSVRSTAELDHSRYSIDLTAGLRTSLPHLSPLRHMVRVVTMRAEMAALEGDTATSARCYILACHLANSLDAEPLIISQLMRCVLVALIVESLTDSLSVADFAESEFDEMRRSVERLRNDQGFLRALIGERTINAENFTMMIEGNLLISDDSVAEIFADAFSIAPEVLKSSYFAGEKLLYLEHIDQLIGVWAKEWPERISLANAFEKDVSNLSSVHILPQVLLSSYSRCVTAFARAEADIRMASAVLAIEKYRLRHLKQPESLSDMEILASENLLDPFSGEAVQYKQFENGYVVYCVGSDLVDNSAEWFDYSEPGDTDDDRVWIVRR